MTDIWIDRYGERWFGYWAKMIPDPPYNGKWDYNVHHQFAETDMGDLGFDELQDWRGPVTPE